MSENEPEEEEEVPSAIYPESGPNREEMINSYLPGKDEWSAKSILDLSDPAAIAALRQMDMMYPEVDDLQPMIDEFLDEFLKSRTSVGGKSREEYKEMFQAMYGKSGDGKGSTAMQLIAPEED